MKILDGRITSPFGLRKHPITGIESGHNGIDIAAAIGTPVLSPCNGWVADTYTHKTGGKTIILHDKDNEMRFGFCHLNNFVAQVGEPVCKGDIIAHSGNTGLSTGPHLHFSAKDGGKWLGNEYIGGHFIDPTNYIEIK